MYRQLRRLTPFFLIFFSLMFIEAGITAQYADARSRGGGRSFKRTAPRKTTPRKTTTSKTTNRKSGFGAGLAGGLLGGALGGMLFGSMFGANGSGMGILPMLLLGVAAYFIYRRFMAKPKSNSSPGYQPPPSNNSFSSMNSGGSSAPIPPVPPSANPLEEGLDEIRAHDPGFDPAHFTEVASDVFFKVQAGWMRRDLDSYRHLLGDELAAEYAGHFAEMKQKAVINKLESIAVRKIEIVDAGSVDGEDFVTVLITANLLDYTVDEKTNDVVEGSMMDPVKFAEKWTWARPVNTENWKLEGVEVVS